MTTCINYQKFVFPKGICKYVTVGMGALSQRYPFPPGLYLNTLHSFNVVNQPVSHNKSCRDARDSVTVSSVVTLLLGCNNESPNPALHGGGTSQ